MEAITPRPSDRRHAMYFNSQSPQDFITARFPNPKSSHLSPKNVSISTYQMHQPVDKSLTLLSTPSPSPPHSTPTRLQLPRSQSSSWWLQIAKSQTPRQEPRSRKISQATIQTDATESQPAFESDAFAVHMPTTREPILDAPAVCIKLPKLPTPSPAQVEAYQTYKEKARQVRAEYKDQRPPSKIVSYDYAHAKANHNPTPLELDISPPMSPLDQFPAGAFPVSPQTPQHSWAKPTQHLHSSPPSVKESTPISISRKPVGLGDSRSNDRPMYPRGDVASGAPTPTKIKVRLTPKHDDPDPVQKESWWGLYNRSSPQASTTTSSRTTSPVKPAFTFTSQTPVVFDLDSNNIGSKAPGSPPSTAKSKPKRNLTSKWAWLRPAGPRVARPTATTVPLTAKNTAYVDPFLLHATPVPTGPNTPTASRPSSPKKLKRHNSPAEFAEKGKFDSGFAQVKNAGSLVLKLCLLVYVLVGLYFVLDAIRQAMYALSAPFRCMRVAGAYVWIGGVWVVRMLGRAWDRWGVKVALKGGWKGW